MVVTDSPTSPDLEVLKLEILEMRRIKFDSKLCYNIINGLCNSNFDEFFTFAPSSVTRGHNYKLIKPLGYSIFIPLELCHTGIHCLQMWSILHHLLSLLKNWTWLTLTNFAWSVEPRLCREGIFGRLRRPILSCLAFSGRHSAVLHSLWQRLKHGTAYRHTSHHLHRWRHSNAAWRLNCSWDRTFKPDIG